MQTNGLTERFNQTLSRSLAKLVNEEQNDWDTHLETILCAYRVSKQKSTGYSPFYMMFHRRPCLPIESELDQGLESACGEESDYKTFMDRMLQVRDDIRIQACNNIEDAQQKQREYFDQRHLQEVANYNYMHYSNHQHIMVISCCITEYPGWN